MREWGRVRERIGKEGSRVGSSVCGSGGGGVEVGRQAETEKGKPGMRSRDKISFRHKTPHVLCV